jgi:radical SAM-linked protein
MGKKQRFRIHFSKNESMRFTSHLDLLLTWERTFRRAGLPLAYSQGFNPRPMLNLAAPLPLGFTSSGEVGDFWLSEIVPEADFRAALHKALPPGLELHQIEEIQDLHGPKLPALASAASYHLSLRADIPELENKVFSLMKTDHLPRVRKNKSYDLRPLIQDLKVYRSSPASLPVIEAKLSIEPGATGRPDEVLDALEIPPLQVNIHRTRIHFRDPGGS